MCKIISITRKKVEMEILHEEARRKEGEERERRRLYFQSLLEKEAERKRREEMKPKLVLVRKI